MGLGGLVLGSPILYLKGRRRMMFQLSGFYYTPRKQEGLDPMVAEKLKMRGAEDFDAST